MITRNRPALPWVVGLLLLGSALAPGSAGAQACTTLTDSTFASTSGDWSESTSWSGGVPGPCTRVHIPDRGGNPIEVTGIPAGTIVHSLDAARATRLRGGSLTIDTTFSWVSAGTDSFDNVIDVDLTVRGPATFSGDGDTYAEAAVVTISGQTVFDSGSAVPMYLDLRNGGRLITQGIARVAGAGLRLNGSGGGLWSAYGQLQLRAAGLQGPGLLQLQSVTLEAREVLALDPASVLSLDASTLYLSRDVTGTGSITTIGNSTLQGKDWSNTTSGNRAQIGLSGATITMGGGTMRGLFLLGSGTFEWEGGHLADIAHFAAGVAVTASGSAQKFIDSGAQVTLAGPTSVEATIIHAGNILSNSGTLTMASAGRIDFVAGGSMRNTGLIKGTGFIGSVTNEVNGVVAPGDPVGTLTLGTYIADHSGTVRIDVHGAEPGQFDVLKTGGARLLSTGLAVTTAEGLVLPIGARLRIVEYTSRFGDFGTQTGLTAPAGRRYVVGYVNPPAPDPGAYLTVEDRPVVPVASIADTTVPEGDPGAETRAVFTISLSEAIAQPVQMTFATFNGTAVQPEHFKYTGAVVEIPAGRLSTTVEVPVYGDRVHSGNRTFTGRIFTNQGHADVGDGEAVATIVENDAPATLAVGDLTVGEAGVAEVLVSRAGADGEAATVTLSTTPGSATSPGDFLAATSTVTLAAGQVQAKVPITLVNDADDETDESFMVRLTDAAGAAIADGDATVTIADDDGPTPTRIVGIKPLPIPRDWVGKGVPIIATCIAACQLTVEVHSGKSAGNSAIASRAVLLGKARARLARAGRARVVVKLSRRGKAYARRKRLRTVVITTTARDSSGKVVDTARRTVKVPRPRR